MRRRRSKAWAPSLVGLAVALVVAAPCPVGAQWVHSYGRPGAGDSLRQVSATPDDGCVVVARNGDFSYPWVLKLRPDGQLEWQFKLVSAAEGNAGAVLVLPDGTIAVSGVAGGQPSVCLLDPAGSVLWAVQLPSPPGEIAYGANLALASDGNLLLAGVIDPASGPSPYAVWVAKLDRTGTILWREDVPATIDTCCAPPSIASLPDGGAVVGGPEGDVERFDAAGTQLWHLHFDAFGFQVAGVAPLLDGSVVVVARAPGPGGLGVAWIARILGDGTVAWQREADVASAGGAVVTPAGTIHVVASATIAPSDAWTWLATLDLGGTLTAQGAVRPLTTGSGTALLADGTLLIPSGANLTRRPPAGLAAACGLERTSAVALVPASQAFSARATAVLLVAEPSIPHAVTAVPTSATVEVVCSAAGCLADAGEPDLACVQVRSPLERGVVASRNFCDDSEDWFAFLACAGQSVRIETSSLGPLADTVLEVWTPDCASPIAVDDDSGGEPRASRIDWVAPADGTYRLRAAQADGTAGTDREYAILVSGPPCRPPTWIRRYVGDGAAAIETVLEDAGTLVAVGRVTSASPEPRGWLLELDPDGEVTSRTEHAGDVNGRFRDAVRMTDGSRVTAGYVEADMPGSEPYLGWIARQDASGTTAWSETFGQPGMSTMFVALDSTPDGGIVVVGNIGEIGRSNRSALVVRLAGDGSIVWRRRFSHPSSIARLDEVAVLDDGTVVAVGSVGSSSTREDWALGLDDAGRTKWQWTVPPTNASGDPVAIVGRPGARALVAFGTWLGELGNDGAIQSQLAFVPRSAGSFVSLCPARDGGTFVVYSSVSLTRFGQLFLLSAAGSLEWARDIGDNVSIRDVFQMSDGGIVLAGQAGTASVADCAWLARLDPLGFGTGGCSEIKASDAVIRDAAFVTTPGVAAQDEPALIVEDLTTPAVAVATSIDERCNASGACLPLAAEIAAPATACRSGLTPFEAFVRGFGPFTYEWDFGYDGVTFVPEATGRKASHVFASTGTIPVALRVTDSCSSGARQQVVSVDVAVDDAPSPVITGPTTRCADDPCTILQAPAGFDSYLWSSGETTASICVSPASSRSYSVAATGAGGCEGRGPDHALTVNDSPSVGITLGCRAGRAELTATVAGGSPPYTYDWGGGITTQSILVGPGAWRVTVTDTAGCSAQQFTLVTGNECAALREVSGSGAPPLRVFRAPPLERLRWEALSGVTAYNVHVGVIGDWLSHSGAAGRACTVRSWMDEGATVSVDRLLPVGSWVVITASNALGEGPAGAGSNLLERSLAAAWDPCGAAP